MDTLPGMLAADVYLTVLAVDNLLRQYLKKGISKSELARQQLGISRDTIHRPAGLVCPNCARSGKPGGVRKGRRVPASDLCAGGHDIPPHEEAASNLVLGGSQRLSSILPRRVPISVQPTQFPSSRPPLLPTHRAGRRSPAHSDGRAPPRERARSSSADALMTTEHHIGWPLQLSEPRLP
jgi:hypothetical protein